MASILESFDPVDASAHGLFGGCITPTHGGGYAKYRILRGHRLRAFLIEDFRDAEETVMAIRGIVKRLVRGP